MDIMGVIEVSKLTKRFRLHTQGRTEIPVFEDYSFQVDPGESVALAGPSGAGKSTLLRLLYGNYRVDRGEIRVMHRGGVIDLAEAVPREVLAVRLWTVGYVSQFLRVVPRVPALHVVTEPLRARGVDAPEAEHRAAELLMRLRIPRRLWSLSPTTFSGGEQQRINLARGFAATYPVMLLDEPTASLDARNRATVVEMIQEANQSGCAVIGIFHDDDVRKRIAGRTVTISPSIRTESRHETL